MATTTDLINIRAYWDNGKCFYLIRYKANCCLLDGSYEVSECDLGIKHSLFLKACHLIYSFKIEKISDQHQKQ